VVAGGVRRTDRADTYVLAEVSSGIGPHDVERAAGRAHLLERLGRPVVPVVAVERIDPESAALARASGVWQMFDGRVVEPA
jgi:hypothetical protein